MNPNGIFHRSACNPFGHVLHYSSFTNQMNIHFDLKIVQSNRSQLISTNAQTISINKIIKFPWSMGILSIECVNEKNVVENEQH